MGGKSMRLVLSHSRAEGEKVDNEGRKESLRSNR